MQSNIFEITVFGISIAPKWYGLMYALGFFICYLFFKKWGKLAQKELDSLLFYVFFGVILGGRLGYIFFYDFDYFFHNLENILKIWEGGMSFHGGLLGVIFAVFLFAKRYKKNFYSITDPLAIIVPIAIGLGRLGNYINRELLGFAPYDGPFGIERDGQIHFPSPLLEMMLEGGVLFIITLLYARWIGYFDKNTPQYRAGYLSSFFLIGYGFMRLISEQFRLPDTHIGYLWGTDWITLGILYTLPMFLLGIIIGVYSRKSPI